MGIKTLRTEWRLQRVSRISVYKKNIHRKMVVAVGLSTTLGFHETGIL